MEKGAELTPAERQSFKGGPSLVKKFIDKTGKKRFTGIKSKLVESGKLDLTCNFRKDLAGMSDPEIPKPIFPGLAGKLGHLRNYTRSFGIALGEIVKDLIDHDAPWVSFVHVLFFCDVGCGEGKSFC